ncbi:MAG: metallophosphoesterase family protein [Pseudomonadota bacterium]
MRIAVISDVHSAAAPFRTALADARAQGFDQLLLLGDLFTYGVDPIECSEIAISAIEKDHALLIGGNHDQLYVDLGEANSAYFDKLPDWIRESVEWTWGKLGNTWPSQLDWIPEWTSGSVFFAHANPFGYGDWTYLANEELQASAATTLRERGYSAGIFGHLHRTRFFRDEYGTEVHVVDSVGQPRSKGENGPSWAVVEITGQNVSIETRQIPFDTDTHCSQIQAVSGLSDMTKSKLCGFYQ